jgi:nucleoside-diphosphate-sugar epimerase
LLDRDLLGIVCQGVDTVIHCAGVELVWPPAALQELVAVTVTGTLNLVEAACACECRRLIRVGMVLPAQASDDLPTGAAHRLVETLSAEHCRHTRLQSLVLRMPEVYGPAQEAVHPSITPIASLLSDLRRGLAPLVCGDPAAPRDFLHVTDLTDAIERACLAELGSHRVVEVGSGQTASIASVLTHLASRGVRCAGRYRRSIQPPIFAACPSLGDAERILHFQPRHCLFSSLDRALPTLRWEA